MLASFLIRATRLCPLLPEEVQEEGPRPLVDPQQSIPVAIVKPGEHGGRQVRSPLVLDESDPLFASLGTGLRHTRRTGA